MAKLIGPLMSLDASGSIAGTLTFSKWKGRPLVRQLVKPSNPKTSGQTTNRAMMKFLSQQWASMSAGNQATWLEMADVGKYSNFNGYVAYNMARWTQFADPTQYLPLDGSAVTNSWATNVATGGVRQATITGTVTLLSGSLWGVMVARNTAAITTITKDMIVGVVPATTATLFTYIDTPLTAATWHYRMVAFSKDGSRSSTLSAQLSAIVT